MEGDGATAAPLLGIGEVDIANAHPARRAGWVSAVGDRELGVVDFFAPGVADAQRLEVYALHIFDAVALAGCERGRDAGTDVFPGLDVDVFVERDAYKLVVKVFGSAGSSVGLPQARFLAMAKNGWPPRDTNGTRPA